MLWGEMRMLAPGLQSDHSWWNKSDRKLLLALNTKLSRVSPDLEAGGERERGEIEVKTEREGLIALQGKSDGCEVQILDMIWDLRTVLHSLYCDSNLVKFSKSGTEGFLQLVVTLRARLFIFKLPKSLCKS